GLERPALLLEPLDLERQRAPVEISEVPEHQQALEQRDALAQIALLALDLRVPASRFGRDAVEIRGALRKRRDLRLVAPAEHIARAVVDRVAIVLLVTFAATLRLTRSRDRLALATEPIEIGTARVVEAARELAL